MSEPFLGQIQPFGFNFPPRGWAHCNGQLLAISTNTALFSLLGTTFGGDGRTTFGLPELRSRSIVHVGSGPGLDTISWGQRGSAPTTTQVPAHTHTFAQPASTGAADQSSPTGNFPAVAEDADRNPLNIYTTATDTALGAGTTGSTGVGGGINIRSPFIGIYYSIALVGLFPSRS